ncbi:MAG: mercuric reductase [Cyanobacteria bacterium KgW148]|nr:mercuric reductase [Cyanobacteria bacterium KgW148]
MNDHEFVAIDRHDRELLAHVHPPDWVNPTPAALYDVVVIGAGTAGLVTAAGIAGLGLGLKVALVEKHLMGGDCLNGGCVPSKSLIRSATIARAVRTSQEFGIVVPEFRIDFPAVMTRLRQIRAGISPHDSASRLTNLGVDVFFGKATFTDRDCVQVHGAILRGKRLVIATGARANIPDIAGLKESDYLTNETIFNLTELPVRLAIIGGGPIGCEMAQAFARLGSQVFVFHKKDRLLDREEEAVSQVLSAQFKSEGINFFFQTQIDKIELKDKTKVIHFSCQGNNQSLVVEQILIATGRCPNLEGLNLDRAGVAYNDRGIVVNDYLQTSNPKIYACGDVCLDWKFTHAADSAARIVIKNMLFSPLGLGRSRLSSLVMPWVTFTDPEVAHVGITGKGQCISIPLDRVDRAITDSHTPGFIQIWYDHPRDRILGATIVAPHAGEMISEITLAIGAKLGLNTLATVIHAYPTLADGIKKAADSYRRTLLTPRSQALLRLLAKLTGLT